MLDEIISILILCRFTSVIGLCVISVFSFHWLLIHWSLMILICILLDG